MAGWPWDARDRIAELLRDDLRPARAMSMLVAWCRSEHAHDDWDRFTALGVSDELPRLESWLRGVLEVEPPPSAITAFWYGLFQPIDPDGTTRAEIYVAGSSHYRPHDPPDDWHCRVAYKPRGCYAGSRVLARLYAYAYRAGGLENDAEYPLALGYAAFAVAHLCRVVPAALLLGEAPERAIFVGFDSGDMLQVGVVNRDGFVVQ